MATPPKYFWLYILFRSHAEPLFKTWWEVMRFVVVLAGLAWGSHWLSERGVLHLTEAQLQAALDIVQRERPASLVEEIVVVPITEDDLTVRFGDQVTADKLFPVLTQLDALGARTVVVDIDTSGPGFRNEDVPHLHHARVVWAHGAEAVHWNQQKERWQYRVYPAVGGRQMAWSGVAVLEGSGDGIVNRYPHCVETDAAVFVPTLHWAAVAAYRGQSANTLCENVGARTIPGHDEVIRINQLHNRYAFKEVPLAVVEHASGEDPVVRDRLLVLGGKYSRADRHRTPFGPKWGWELQAAAMAATLEDVKHAREGEHARETEPAWWPRQLIEFLLGLVIRWWPLLLIEFLLGLVIRWMHQKLRWWLAVGGTLFVLSVVVLYAAELAAQWSGFRMALVPFLIGIWLHQLVERGE